MLKATASAAAFIVLLCASLSSLAQSDRKHIVLNHSPALATAPFSDAVLVGDTLYVAGYFGIDPKTNKPPASPEQEAKLAIDNFKRTVEAAGMSMDDLVMVNVLCTDLNLFNNFNTVYRTYFHNGFPARTFTGASSLLLGAHFEITGVAVKRAK